MDLGLKKNSWSFEISTSTEKNFPSFSFIPTEMVELKEKRLLPATGVSYPLWLR